MQNGKLDKARLYAKELESRLEKLRTRIRRMEAEQRSVTTTNDVEAGQAVRDLIHRLRVGAWMSGEELDDRADVVAGATLEIEARRGPLTELEWTKTVAMLEVLLTCRRGYRASILQWRAATGLTRRQAAFIIGITKNNLGEIERGKRKWPHAKTRDAIDRVLTEWENSDVGQRALKIAA